LSQARAPARSQQGHDDHHDQPGAETDDGGGYPVPEAGTEGPVDAPLDGDGKPGGHSHRKAHGKGQPGCMGHSFHLTSGIITGMSNPEFEEIPIRDTMIRLGQLLKLANLVEDGVEATELIKNGLVKVNGEIDDRRGRQLHNGDTVTVNGQTVRVSAPQA
jgi:ribosome-associated protein